MANNKNNLNPSRTNEQVSIPRFKCASLSSHRRKIGIKANILFVQTFFQLPFFPLWVCCWRFRFFFPLMQQQQLADAIIFVRPNWTKIELSISFKACIKCAVRLKFNKFALSKWNVVCVFNKLQARLGRLCVFEFEFASNEHKAGQINAIIANCMLAGVAS